MVLTVLSLLAGAWLAAGSTGLLGHGLRRALVWAALGIALFAGHARRGSLSVWAYALRLTGLAAAAGVTVCMVAMSLPAGNVLGVAVLAAVLAAGWSGPVRRALLLAALGAFVLGLYVLARVSIPAWWLVTDRLGGTLGALAAGLTGRPLWVGASFGGLDFLVLMTAFLVGWLVLAGSGRLRRGICAVAAICAVHLLYLVVLTCAADLVAGLPDPSDPEVAKRWSWAGAAAKLVPWNMPALAGLLHLLVAGAMLRWTTWEAPESTPGSAEAGAVPAGQRVPVLRWAGVVLLAAAVPVLVTLTFGRCSMAGKKVVVFREGFLNWLKPRHGDYGRLSIGMYGMLPKYIEALGGKCLISPRLSEKDLDKADVLILLYPNERWEEGQLERIWKFVRGGGSLAVFGEHTIHEPENARGAPTPATGAAGPRPTARRPRGRIPSSRFNEVLEPTAMRVRFDSATFAVGGWLQSYQPLAHPATIGVGDDRNQFGVVIGASVQVGWPAWPVLVGRWGWADPGDEGRPAMMGNHKYDPGEKLGDLTLAAEQRLGKGRVICFGDTSGMTNGINIGSHVFTSRLLGYLANHPGSPQAPWRQLLGGLCLVVLMVLIVWGRSCRLVAAAGVVLGLSLWLCAQVSYGRGEVLPDGRRGQPNDLAYVDATHMEAQAQESWRPEGNMGLMLNLMRSGYLALDLPEFTQRRLERAGLLISIAPARQFSRKERRWLRQWVRDGGVFICTVGYDRRRASEPLLRDFGFRVGLPPGANGEEVEPQPLGHFKSPYLSSGHKQAYVRFHAAWPVTCDAPDHGEDRKRVIAYGRRDQPVIVMRYFGKGKVVVVGDTCFAMNKNLERYDGRPIEGRRENADFWRWLLSVLRDQQMWVPAELRQPSRPPSTRGQATRKGGAPAGTSPPPADHDHHSPAETSPRSKGKAQGGAS